MRHNYLPGPALHGDVGQVGVLVDAPKPLTAPNPGVAAGQGPAITQYGGTPGTLAAAAIVTLALEHGCSPGGAVIAAAISMAESAGSPSAQGDIGLMTPVWDWSAGLWQIRGLRAERNTGALRDSVANQDANKNAAAMYAISQGCTGWTPWSTYTSGAYVAFQALAQRAVEYVFTYFNAHGRRYPAVPAPDPNSAIPVQSSGGGDNPAAAAAASSAQTPTAPAPQPNGSAPKPARTSAAAPRISTPASAPTSPGEHRCDRSPDHQCAGRARAPSRRPAASQTCLDRANARRSSGCRRRSRSNLDRAGLSASPSAPASSSGSSTTSAKPTHVAVPVSTPTDTPTTSRTAACLTPAAALALVQAINNGTPIRFQSQPGAYACQGGWAVVNYITNSTRDHSTVDLRSVNGTWVIGNRIAACGPSGYGSGGAMPLTLQRIGCGN